MLFAGGPSPHPGSHIDLDSVGNLLRGSRFPTDSVCEMGYVRNLGAPRGFRTLSRSQSRLVSTGELTPRQ